MNTEITEIKNALSVIKLWLDSDDFEAVSEKVKSEYADFRLNQAGKELNKALSER